MKYRNKETGVVLEPRSEVVDAQLRENEQFEEATAEPSGEKTVDRMNKAELLAKAAELGIELPEGAKNDDIKTMIKAASDQ